jgi:hypothetical protein
MATPFHITSWLRAFFALQESAVDGRGVVEVAGIDDEIIRWPRTLVADVVAVAGLFDRFVREQPLRFGARGLGRRWRVCVDEVARYARVQLASEYAENRFFWRTLPAICVYLHARASPLPQRELFDALLSRFDHRRAVTAASPRNTHV